MHQQAHGAPELSTGVSLAVFLVVLTVTGVASLIKTRSWDRTPMVSGNVSAMVGPDLVHPPGPIREPADALGREAIKRGHVGLDVKHRCAVEQIEPGHLEDRAGGAEQAHHRDADRVGMPWGAGGEDAAHGVVEVRHHLELARHRAM